MARGPLACGPVAFGPVTCGTVACGPMACDPVILLPGSYDHPYGTIPDPVPALTPAHAPAPSPAPAATRQHYNYPKPFPSNRVDATEPVPEPVLSCSRALVLFYPCSSAHSNTNATALKLVSTSVHFLSLPQTPRTNPYGWKAESRQRNINVKCKHDKHDRSL